MLSFTMPLSRGRQTIALLTTSLIEGWRSPAWEVLAMLAKTHDFNLLIFAGGMLKSPVGFEAQANSLYDFVNTANVDGVIVTGGLGHYVGPAGLQQFCERFRPLPVVSLEVQLDGFPSIIPDFYAGMRAVMTHLFETHGYRRIGFIRGATDSKTGEDRYRAYVDSLEHYGLPVDPDLIAPGNFFPPSGAEAVELLLDRRLVTIDALVAANDHMAIDAMQALQARGIRVPQDVAVTGFDNLESAQAVVPQLTTVELPAQKEARLATDLLLQGRPAQNRIDVQTELVLRQSCGCQSMAMAKAEVSIPPAVGAAAGMPLFQVLADQCEAIQAAMLEACDPSPAQTDLDLIIELCAAFTQDLQDADGEAFISFLKSLANSASVERMNLTEWQGLLSAHRHTVLPLLNDARLIRRAENLWQHGRVCLAETALNLEAQREYRSNQLDAALRTVGERLITTFNLTGLMDMVVSELPRLGIPACYVVLYPDRDPRAPQAKLIVAYDQDGRLPLEPGGRPVETSAILPANVLPRHRRYSHAVCPLNFHEDHLGYVVFEIGPRNGMMYETLSLQLSSALRGALLVQELQARAAELAQSQAQAEKADQLKTRLLANVTHELRTPLNVILGYSRMALMDTNPYQVTLPATLRSDLENVHRSGEHLVRLINDLLDLSRAEIGELDLFLEPVAPRQLLEQTFRAMADSIQPNPAVKWRLELPPRLPVVQADPTRLRQIILNLLSNADKFTEAGEIVLGAEVVPPHLHVWVKDTGPGIPVDRQEHIFEPFFTESHSRRRPEGIGLGLTITRRLIALHGGSLSLESQPGRGSSFHLYFPLPSLGGRQLQAAPAADSDHRLAVLLISAVDPTLPEIEAMAARVGWDLQRVASQPQLKNVLDKFRPAALAWDLAHARPGDWTIIQQIHSHPHLCQIPFILYREEALTDAQAAPALTNILVKPLNPQTFTDLIDSFRPAPAGGSILVVDDDPQARELYFRIVSERLPGFPVVLAEDGRVALEWLEHETPSLVILDLAMPNVDGFTVLEQIRSNRRTHTVPVFVLTGRLLNYEDIQRLDYNQVVLHFKQVMSEKETGASVERVFSGAETMPRPTSHLVKQALVYLQQNYTHTLSRAEVAAAVGVSEDYLSRIFNKEMGLSPWDYLNRYRVLQAKVLLRESKENITWIAAQVGFEDPAYFTRVFQKIVGCSPRQYRLQP
jgi:signal transduction histidine kinase/DNA-binding LacI/PurR family transcriptional regulator/AraC-like DNA-binding protein